MQIGVEGADARGQATAAIDVRLLHDHDAQLGRALSGFHCGDTAGGTAAEDQKIAITGQDLAHRRPRLDSRKSSVPATWTQSLVSSTLPLITLTTMKAQGHISVPWLAKVAASSREK